MSEVENRPVGRMSRERRFGVAVSLALIVGGGWWAARELTTGPTVADLSFPVTGDALVVEVDGAEVDLRSGDVTDIEVTRHHVDGLLAPDPDEDYRDGRLELSARCGILSIGGCDSRYVVVVPRNLRVTVESRSGDVTVTDLATDVAVTTNSGDVEVSGLRGGLTAETSSGSVEAEGLQAARVRARSSSGDIDLEFAVPPTAVTAESSSGDVEVRVPNDSDAYRVETDTSSGDEATGVRTDPAADRSIEVESSSGDVTVTYGAR